MKLHLKRLLASLAALTIGVAGVSVVSSFIVAPAAAPTTRDATLWPFASTDPFNMPLGSGATFGGGSPINSSNSTPWINYDSYSVPVCYASNSDPLVTITASSGSYPGPHTYHVPATCQPAAGGDAHMAVISPDRLFSDETWATSYSGNTGSAGVYLHVDLQGAGVGLGWARATGVSILAGLIRSQEVAAGSIPHALSFSAPAGLTGSFSYTWPAISSDGAGEGALLAIPSTVAKPAGLSSLGSAIFDAMQHYGAYNVDTSGAGAVGLFVEPTADANAVNQARNEIASIMALLQIVTNNGPNSVGGPGTRLAPLAPAFGAGTPPPTTQPPGTTLPAGPYTAGALSVTTTGAIKATLTNGTKATIAGPGVGFYVGSTEVSWASTPTPLAAGASVTLDTASAPGHGAVWNPAPGTYTLSARPGSNGVDATTGGVSISVVVNAPAPTTTVPPPPTTTTPPVTIPPTTTTPPNVLHWSCTETKTPPTLTCVAV